MAEAVGLDFLEGFDDVADFGQHFGQEDVRSLLSEEFLKELEPFPSGDVRSAWTDSLDSGASTASSDVSSPDLSPASPLHSPSSSDADSANHSPPPCLQDHPATAQHFSYAPVHFAASHPHCPAQLSPQELSTTPTPRNVVLVIPPGAPVSLTSSQGLVLPKAGHAASQPSSHYPTIMPKKPSDHRKQARSKAEGLGRPVLLAPVSLPFPVSEVKLERPSSVAPPPTPRPASVRPSPAATPSPLEPGDFASRREQRKIRNREAAQLSRQRKKEAVEELGQRLALSQAEVAALRKENQDLRAKNAALAREAEELRRSAGVEDWSDAPRRKFPRSTTSKAAAVSLLAIFGLLTFSITPLASYNPVASQAHVRLPSAELDAGAGALEPLAHFRSRTLMSLEAGSAGSELRERMARVQRSLRDASSANVTREDCRRLYVNQTESRRLADELSLWMDMHAELSRASSASRASAKAWARQGLKRGGLRAERKERREGRREEPLRGLQLSGIDYVAHRRIHDTAQGEPDQGELALFSSPEQRYIQRLREALRKRDDTFYLVSFRKDFVVLPAESRNSSRLPRMSLVVPVTGPRNGSDDAGLRMMQIDCDVTATGLLHLPEGLRSPQRPAQTNAQGDNSTATAP